MAVLLGVYSRLMLLAISLEMEAQQVDGENYILAVRVCKINLYCICTLWCIP